MNEALKPLVDSIISAIVTAVVTDDAFKTAVRQVAIDRINEEETMVAFDGEKFRAAVKDVAETVVDDKLELDGGDLDDKIKEVVQGMSFSVEVSRY